jgi:carbon-monoxide dehydrogenase large subunit
MSFLDSRTSSARQGVGKPVPRREDERLITGRGCYSDDFSLPGQVYAVLVRSPYAHARIRGIDAADALATAGVIAVLTGRDATHDGLKPIPYRPISPNPHEVPLKNRDGSPVFLAPYPALSLDTARFVGAAVAVVVAETVAAAKDAAERVVVDYEPLAAVTATRDAIAADAPRVWNEIASNVCVDCDAGDAAAADAAFRRAAHVVRLETTINRVTGVPMEPRAALAAYDEASGRYTVYAASGGVQRHRTELAGVLGVPESAVRMVTRDLGGNYGTRNNLYPEFALVAWAARRVRRPVKWTCERQEAFLSDEHARDLASQAELALDAEGNFLALRCVNTSNVGAHAVSFIPLAKGIGVSTSVYRFPAASIRGRAVLSNTSPTTPYRAAGRPEVMFIVERLIDVAARRHGFDRVALRRRNLVPASAMPYRNPFGLVYDSGDYAAAQDRVLALADWAGFEARRAEARRRGRYRGIGLGNYIELNTGVPRERAEIRVLPEGRIDVVLGTLSAGQGHETSFAQLMAEWFDVELAQVRLITGDTDVAPVGGGSHSGRSMRMGAVVMARASDEIVAKGKQIAAGLLEAAAIDIEFARGRFTVKGTDRSVGLFEAAAAAPLAGAHDETTPLPSYPYGCAVCEVEVDPETGVVEVVRHSSVDDCGRAVNPLILHGQTHGGIAAGVGQALWESCHYDAETGQLLSGSFMDYAMPRADQFPAFATEISEVPSTTHPLGMRGGGEGGTTPALAAVANAIVDALAHLGVEHIELPATPERVWRAIRAARA